VTDPNLAVPVAEAIDRLSANSSHETKTESIRELAQQQVQQIGDFDFLIRAVVSAVLAALLFAIASMMVQSVPSALPSLQCSRPSASRTVPCSCSFWRRP